MAGNNSIKPTTVATLARLVNEAASKKKSKRDRKTAKSNSRGSGSTDNTIATRIYNSGPIQSAAPNGAVRIQNSEFVTDVATPGSILSWDLNPNSGSLFTWLSRVAVGYELFRFTSLEFIYTPICSSTTTGVVVLAPDYDASDLPPTTKQVMSAYAGSARGNVWNRLSCRVATPKGWYFIGNNAGSINPVGTDIKFYDFAKFYLGVFNSSTPGAVGELTVKYTCEFSKPDFGPPPAPGESIVCNSPTYTDPVGTSPTLQGNLPVTIATAANGTVKLTFNASGRFVIQTRSNVSSSVNYSNPWQAIAQTDPGSPVVTVPWGDSVSNFSTGGALYAALGYYVIDAVVGTVVLQATAATVSALSYLTFKISSYSKTAATTG